MGNLRSRRGNRAARQARAALSGWIKVEKDLSTDPRVLRMASRLRNADVTLGSRARLVIVGALVTLWWYADTHIREDDTLPVGADQINELVGVENFCDLMPADWLVIVDSNNVKLIDYTAHNGTTAKKRALGQKRQERHRSNVNADVTPTSRSHNTNCVTRPREDQDLEKTKNRKKGPSDPVEQKSLDVAEVSGGTIDRVFDHWREVHGHTRAVLDAKRRKLIRAALDRHSEADLCQAISGYKLSPHHMGQNDHATVYDDIDVMIRDSKHVEAGLKFYAQPPRTDLSSKTRANVAAIADWQPPELRNAGQ